MIQPTTPLQLRLTPAHLGMRVDVVLAQLLPDYSRSRLQQWCELGVVLQNGTVLAANNKIKKVANLSVTPQQDHSLDAFLPEDIKLDILYVDDDLLVVNKPVGLVVHPGAGNWTGTLMNAMLHHYPESAQLPRAGIVHRLDRDTSGLMVVARTSAAYVGLVHAMKARDVHRRYVAIIHGVPGWLETRVDMAIGRDPKMRTRMAALPGTVARASTGKPAITDVRCIASNAPAGASLVECKLHSGRTHQIRVHMSHTGHALVGDSTYGGKPILDMQRQALHAWRLSFIHPVSGNQIAVFAPPPQDLQHALTLMGVHWSDIEPALKVDHQFASNLAAEGELVTPDDDMVWDFDEHDIDEDDDHDVELIYVRE